MTTTAAPRHDVTDGVVPPEILDEIAASAAALDQGQQESRAIFPRLGGAGLLDLGAPGNHDGGLAAMAEAVREIAGRCMSTAFSLWATRMTIEYLRTADTPAARAQADELASGTRLGITGMASAFKDLAGCGELDLRAEPVADGYLLDGRLPWASNLYDDAVLVTAARTGRGEKVVVALPLATDGVTVGTPFSLLALGATASSSVTLERVHVTAEQVLTTDVAPFLTSVRPTFMTLQAAMCLGLADTCVQEARRGLTGVNASFAGEVDQVHGRALGAVRTLRDLAARIGGDTPPARTELLALRLAAAEIATTAAGLEIRTAGGKGYASATPASRRFREATFIPVQSPSEGQLRWELASGR